MPKQDIIGQTADIYLPEITEQVITARVDTGAETSAIWVSNIHESGKVLHVNFLGNNDKHTVSLPVEFKEFEKVTVVSSNSLSEERYKVKLLVVVNDRKIRTWFTLTDRSKRTYPVLLGRNILNGKFLVDVSHNKPTI